MLNIEVNGNKIAIEGEATVRILPNGAVEVTSRPEVKAPEPPANPAANDDFSKLRKLADELRYQ